MCGPGTRGAFLLLLCLGAWCIPAASQEPGSLLDRRANLDVERATPLEALQALQRASGVAIAFSPDVITPDRAVTCQCQGVKVSEALDRILRGTGLVYALGRRQILVGRRAENEPGPAQQTWILVGVVVDGDGHRPVAGADVSLSPLGHQRLTDAAGRFVFPGIPAGHYQVRVQALGYEPAEIATDVGPGQQPLDIRLVRRPIPLQEIVIAPGHLGMLEAATAAMGGSVNREDIEAIPQFGDDAFRTLQRMPGVAVEDISTRLNVRGGSDVDLLVRLDGVELVEPYHLKDWDGALGIVDVQALGGMDLVSGGFPAEYGDHTGGVLDMRTREPPPVGVRSTVGMSLSSISLSSQGSFARGDGQWLASVRRGFLDIALRIAGADDQASPRYWDALGKVRYLVSPNHLISFEILHAGDDNAWADPDDTGSRVESVWSNGYGWGSWRASFSDRLRAETVASVGQLARNRRGSIVNSEDGVFTPLQALLRDRRRFTFFDLRQDWQLDLSSVLMLKAGFNLRRTSGDYDYARSATFLDIGADDHIVERVDSATVVLDAAGTTSAAYGALRGQIADVLTWEAGTRYHRYSQSGDEGVAPRLMVRWDASPTTVARASWGHYYQPQGVNQLHVGDGEMTFSRAERADQVAAGIEHRFGSGLTARAEAYRRRVGNPLPLFLNLAREINPLTELESDRRRIDPTRARAQGLELYLEDKGIGSFSWSASYALAKSEVEVDGTWAPRTLDQRHTLTLMGTLRQGRAWQVSGLWHYHTGWPVTDQYFDAQVTEASGGEVQRAVLLRRGFGPLNRSTLPDYQRFDLRVTRGFDLTRGRLELFLDIFNLLNRKNYRSYEWILGINQETGAVRARREPGEEMLPILPTLGFRWVF